MSIANAAHGSMMGVGKKPTVRDYVQNGLVAMWDVSGQPPGSNIVIDITGNGHDIPMDGDGDYVGNDRIEFRGKTHTANGDVFNSYTTATFEACALPTAYLSYDAPMVEIPYIGGISFDGRGSGFSVYRPNGLNGSSYVYIAYESGFSSIQAIINAGVYQTYSATPLYGSLSSGLSPVYVNGKTVGRDFQGVWWSGNTRLMSLKADVTVWSRPSMKSIRIYSRELTATEVATNHAVDVARFNLPAT